MQSGFRNWSGSVQATPREFHAPRTEAELAEIVAGSSQVRVTGAGHSFMPPCATAGTLLDLSQLEMPLEIEPDGQSVWAPAGWSLEKLTAALWTHGYSLPNQGDVNPQALAGALATGTHGTGAELGSLATIARAFRLVLAEGSIVTCSATERAELFEAARLSLGSVGVATHIRIQVLPAYRLEERVVAMPLREVALRFAELAARHRHVEFFVFPYADTAILKTLHPTEDASAFRPVPASDEHIFKFTCDVTASWPAATSVMQRT